LQGRQKARPDTVARTERVGRLIAGDMTFDQVMEDILREFGLTDRSKPA
jgi:hypothetical protein